MFKKLLGLFATGMLCAAVFSNLGLARAQFPAASEQLGTVSQTAIIAQSPSNAATEQSNSKMRGKPFVPAGLATSEKPFEDRVIIEDDNRAPLTSRKYPWSAIGRVEWLTADGRVSATCTGSLIGRDLVLTNSHCLIDKETHQPTQYRLRFRPNLINGRSPDEAMVETYEYGTNFADGKEADDWALLKISKPLGDRFGTLGWISLDFSDPDWLSRTSGRLNLAGYSGDFPTKRYQELTAGPSETAGVHLGCSIVKQLPDSTLLHDCDTMPGASGSPIFGKFGDGDYYIVGLHAAGRVDRTANIAMNVSRWSQRANAMKSQSN